MTINEQIQMLHDTAQTLRNTASASEGAAAAPDRRAILNTILQQARTLAWAEAGSLYILEKGQLRFLAAQNDRLPLADITRLLLDREMPASTESLAGFVASVGRATKIDDTDALTGNEAFRVNRDLDADTGFRAKSILAVPLRCPDGEVIGVLELFNRIGPDSNAVPFPSVDDPAILSLASMAAVAVHNALLQAQLKQAYVDTMLRLSAVIEFKENETVDHLRQVSNTSVLLAEAMDLSANDVRLLKRASPMHDVGKVAIPDTILCKPARLTVEERKIVETHPLMGAEILGEAEGNEVTLAARDIALSHHERWDGRGYPHRLKGEQIPLHGRIVGLADVLDALLSHRRYKQPFTPDVAVEAIRLERGKHFDPDVADAFFSISDRLLATYNTVPQPSAVPAN